MLVQWVWGTGLEQTIQMIQLYSVYLLSCPRLKLHDRSWCNLLVHLEIVTHGRDLYRQPPPVPTPVDVHWKTASGTDIALYGHELVHLLF